VKVLIAGSGGQVGRALVAGAPAGCELIAATHADLDIADADAVAGCVESHRPDLIVNAAAYTDVGRAESEPETAARVNANGPEYLATAAAACSARMIHVSTNFVFDGTASKPYPPDARPAPLSIYGETKLAGERAVSRCLPDASIVLRTAWVYGPHGRNFLLTMLRLMRNGKPVRVVADEFGTPTTAASVAGAIWAFAMLPDRHGTYHWTDAGEASWYEFAQAIAQAATACGLLVEPVDLSPVSARDFPTPVRRPRYAVLDTRSAVEAIGMTPRDWRSNLEDVIGEIARG
jgi:dTDP-4-dehydrorhamnose reductase